MKKLIYIIVISTLVALLSSCDVLEEDLVSDVSTDSHYTTLTGFQDAVNASYAPLRTIWGNETGAYLEAYGTDIIMNAGHGGWHHYNQYEGALNPDDGLVDRIWTDYYDAINIVNAAINRAEDISVPASQQTLKDTRLGEVHALRAFYYFTLVQHFGALHLTTEETSGIETQANRTEPSVVYEQIVSDLETALDYLEGQGPNGEHIQFGRINEAVAKMMLSHVLLTRGYQDFGASNDFERAATLSESVISDYNYSLVDDYEQIFAQDNQENSEIIWSVQYGTSTLLNGGDDAGNHSHVYYRPWYETYGGPQGTGAGLVRTEEYGRPWIRFKMTRFALENFRPIDQDARFEKSFQSLWRYNDASSLPPNAAVGDTAIYIDPDMTAAEVTAEQPNKNYYLMSWATVHEAANINMFPNLSKHDDFERSSVNDYGGTKDYFVYRLAEAFLFAAEARFQMGGGGNMQTAANHINVVRERAAWPGQEAAMTANTLNQLQTEGIDFILNERAREFYGEDKRWTTLKRTGKLIERVSSQNYVVLEDTRNNVVTSAPAKYGNEGYKFLLRPIPTDQITRTEGGFEQNPGY